VLKGDDLTTFIGALTFWNPKSHIRLLAENFIPVEAYVDLEGFKR
jgi:hypothetical protein